MKLKTITLSNKDFEKVKNYWSGECVGNYEGDCLCGYYGAITDVGYLALETHCHKASECPDGMNWYVEDKIRVFSSTLCNLGYVPDEEEVKDEDIDLLGYLDKTQTEELREVVRQSIIRDYSTFGNDEYGNNPNHKEDEVVDTEPVLDEKSVVINRLNVEVDKIDDEISSLENKKYTYITDMEEDISRIKFLRGRLSGILMALDLLYSNKEKMTMNKNMNELVNKTALGVEVKNRNINEWIGRKVRHFKGKEYLVIDVPLHTEEMKPVVYYKALYGECKTFVRPLEMFMSKTDKAEYPNATQEYRMELVED